MKLKTSKFSFFFFIKIILIASLLIPLIIGQNLDVLKNDINQHLMTTSPGFSSRASSIGSESSFLKNIELLKKTVIHKSFEKNIKFERMDINISFMNYEKILKDREKALKNDLLKNATYTNGEILFRDKKYKVKLRLKGDTNTHWKSKIRMSLRVSVNNDTIFSNNEFSISKPAERSHPYDMVFQKSLKDLDLISTNHKFVDLYINGSRWGIMNIEEQMSSVFLEKQKKKESAIVKFSNEQKWSFRNKFFNDTANDYKLSDPKLFIQLYKKNKSLKKNKIRKYFSYISEKQIEGNKKLFNNNQLSKGLIISSLWGWHPTNISNTRFYFNPYNLTLEPILTDQVEIGDYNKDQIQEFGYFKFNENEHFKNLILSQEFTKNLEKNFKEVSEVLSQSDFYFKENLSLFPLDKDLSSVSKNKLLSNIRYINSFKDKSLFYKNLIFNSTYDTGEKFNFKENYQKLNSFLHVKHYNDGTLKLYNLLPHKIKIEEISNGKSTKKYENLYLDGHYSTKNNPLEIKTNFVGYFDNKISIVSRYKNKLVTDKNYISLEKNSFNPILIRNKNHKDLISFKDGYSFNKKKVIINNPLILGKKLYVSEGTEIFFSKNAYLILKNGIDALGKKNNPIKLLPLQDYWKGLMILESEKKSLIKNVIINNIQNLSDGILDLDGGLNIYKSEIHVENLEINNSRAEDAINIILSNFLIKGLRINNTTSDGIDFDFSKGSIFNSEFKNIGGDGVDTSGSEINLKNIRIENAKDKSVSIGENSIIKIDNLFSINSDIGIVSKDGSSVSLKNSTFKKSKKYSAMTFFKKTFYNAPILNVKNTNFDNKIFRQLGTTLVNNNIKIPEENIDVEKLYK